MFSSNLLLATGLFSKLVFAVVLIVGLGLFAWQMRQVFATIRLGRKDDRSDKPSERLSQMILVAFGQKKMFKKFIPAFLHFCIYSAFLVTQIELIEIMIDGFTGNHRILFKAFASSG